MSRCRVLFVLPILLTPGCRQTPQEREHTHLANGNKYFSNKEYRKAYLEFKIASQNMPKDAEPLYRLGLTYMAGAASGPALESFQKAVELNPRHEGAQLQLALFKVRSSRIETVREAQQALSVRLQAHPGDFETANALALAEAKLGNEKEATRLLALGLGKDPSDVTPLADVVRVYAAKGDIATSKQISRALSEAVPNSPAAAIVRGQVSIAAKDPADADVQIGKALELKPDYRPALELKLRREVMNEDTPGATKTIQDLSHLPEKSLWGAYARVLFAQGKVAEGEAEYNKALKEHGDDPQLRYEYAAELISAGRRKEAEPLVAATLAKFPKDQPSLMQRATLELDAGNLDSASRDIKTLQDGKMVSPWFSYLQSRLFAARGESVRQGDLLTETLRLNPRFVAARLDLARLLTASGKGRNALSVLDEATPREKATQELAFARNSALMAIGNWDEAQTNVDAALKKQPSPALYYLDGVAKNRNHDLPGARKSLEAGLKLAPTDSGIINLLGEVMRQQGEMPKYIATLREIAKSNPGTPGVQMILGAQLARAGDRDGARAAFEAAKSAGDTIGAERLLATLDLQAGLPDLAKSRLLEQVKSHDNAKARLLLAEIETAKGTPSAVIENYTTALKLEPANATAMNNFAAFLSTQNRPDDALFWARKAKASAPGSPIVDDTLGWVLYRQGKYAEALPLLQSSLKGMDRPVAHYHLAGALLKTGDAARAKKEYEEGVRLDPHTSARADVSALFESK